MRGHRKSISLYARIAMWFLRLQCLNAVDVKVRGFSYVDADVITFPFMPTTTATSFTDQSAGAKAVCVSQLLPSTVSKCIHGHRLESFLPSLLVRTFLSVSQSTVHEPGFAIAKLASLGCLSEVHSQTLDIRTIQEPARSVRSFVDVDFPSAIAERHQTEFSREPTVGFLIEGISTPKAHLESPTFKHSTSKFERAGLIFGPAYTSPFPLRLTPSEQTELLAMVHNDLLYRINNGLRFIGEVDKGIEKFEQLKEEIRLWVEVYGLKAAAPMIWAEYPGAAAYFLVSAAVYEYAHGEYWDFALNAIGIPSTPIFQRYWGQRLLWFLHAVGLHPFDGSGLRYVGPILAHAMIPNDCLPEFFGQLLEPAVRFPAWTGLSPQELIAAWLSHHARFVGVDKPVWQFLRHGDWVAEEFVSEAVRMVRKRFETGLIPQSSEFTLPLRIVQQYRIWLKQQPEPPSPRSPFLRLDLYLGILLSFPEQRLPAECAGEICSWEVTAGGRRLRGPRNYTQRRGEEAVFSAPEIPVPSEGPYEIKLLVGEENAGAWSLVGMTVGRSWKAFSGRNYRELDVSRCLRSEPTWIVIQTGSTLIVRDSCGTALANVEMQRCHLGEEWMGYNAIEVNLTTAAGVEVLCGNYKELINVEHPEGEVVFTGGNLLQNAENSPDSITLFGNAPPKVFLRTKPGEESASFKNVRIRIAGHGPEGSHTHEPSLGDLASASQMETGQVIIDLRQVIPLQICPGEMTIILWYCGRRLADYRFRWIPGLWWEWDPDGRTVKVHVPEGATLSDSCTEESLQPLPSEDRWYIADLPEEHHQRDLVLSWQKRGLLPFSVPMRLHSPRWAFLRHPSSDTPVWQVRPIEISPDDLLKADSPCVLLEARDIVWQEAELRAQWIGCAKEEPTVDLETKRVAHNDRWLIRLAKIADTLRRFQDSDSRVIVEGTITGSREAMTIQICVMRLLSPTMFLWSVQLAGSSSPEWSKVCIDLGPEDLIQVDSPDILFEASGGRWVDAEVRAFWRPRDQTELSHELVCVACPERGRWRIDLEAVLILLEEFSTEDSEIWLEARTPGIQNGDKAEMALVRLHLQPVVPPQTYKECIQWAEGNRLRTFALDLLCDLSYKYEAPVDLLAMDWKTSPELVRRALLAVTIECPDVTVIERQNTFRVSKETYRSMYPVLNEWN
ncbi:MAG: hypothetical protein ABSB22_10060, partial [Thermodesulfobacteriota bacterium]